MGKQKNKWKLKCDRLRLQAGWGKKGTVAPIQVGLQAGVCLADFERAREALVMANVRDCFNVSNIFFKPKPVADSGKPFASAHNFGERLIKRGYNRLGSGCFSTVYAKGDSDRVLKVTRNIDNWIDYIHWASEKGYAGKFAPKVYSYKKYNIDGETFSVAVVERMAKGYRNVKASEDAHIASVLLRPCMCGNTMASLYLDDFQPGLPKFLLDFKDRFGDNNNDIGGDNMMVRKDGSFCLTDPLCGMSEITVNRLRSRDFTSLGLSLKDYNASDLFQFIPRYPDTARHH